MSKDIISIFMLLLGARDWRSYETYRLLLDCDGAGIATAWLIRYIEFLEAMQNLPCLARKNLVETKNGVCYITCKEKCPLNDFGVECCMLDPHTPTLLWQAKYNHCALELDVTPATRGNGGDNLRACPQLIGVLRKGEKELHLLFRDGALTFQATLHGVTSIDRPVMFLNTLQGLRKVTNSSENVNRLCTLIEDHALQQSNFPDDEWKEREIKIFQVWDAKMAGATHREIGNVFFKGERAFQQDGWKDPYRNRVNRVVNAGWRRTYGREYLKAMKGKGKLLKG